MALRQRCSLIALFAMLAIATPTLAQEVAGPSESKIYVKVTQNRSLSGIPIELTELSVKTGFGEVTIPMSKIDGIRMHADANDAAVIAFKNGDLVTGTINLEQLSIKTDWGKAHIQTEQIEAITSNPNASFTPENTGGTRTWRFNSGILSNR